MFMGLSRLPLLRPVTASRLCGCAGGCLIRARRDRDVLWVVAPLPRPVSPPRVVTSAFVHGIEPICSRFATGLLVLEQVSSNGSDVSYPDRAVPEACGGRGSRTTRAPSLATSHSSIHSSANTSLGNVRACRVAPLPLANVARARHLDHLACVVPGRR